MNSEESKKKGFMRGFRGRKGKEKQQNYIISKNIIFSKKKVEGEWKLENVKDVW